MKKKLLILAGDGIGPEVMNEVKKIIAWFNKNKSTDFDITEELAGGISFDKHGTPITDKVMEVAMASDAVLLGAVGGPKWDKLEFSKRPERALLRLRKDLELFANLRPAICFKELANASTLKPEVVSDLDIMIVRELTGGIYFGTPRGVEKLPNGEKKAQILTLTHQAKFKELLGLLLNLQEKEAIKLLLVKNLMLWKPVYYGEKK